MTVRLEMTDEHARAVADALSYFLMAAENNYGSGYERGNEDDALLRREYEMVEQVSRRLNKKIE